MTEEEVSTPWKGKPVGSIWKAEHISPPGYQLGKRSFKKKKNPLRSDM